MNRRPSLPPEKADELNRLLRASGEKQRSGELREAMALGSRAWDLLPDPKEGWDFYPEIIARSQMDQNVAAGDAQNAKRWIDRTYRAYGDEHHQDGAVNMMDGAALFELGLKGEAYAVFEDVYNRLGREWFGGEYASHLEFLLKERARRRG
ncbi:hypothetical protein [Aureimonas leprariae]|uniref:Uncharacterized protein n=1 Tax=Plantimonas leprariae TaxID=2615207 RepID=A0A7V7TYJ3_9HYPH|nr:hypothetical protein [Aureimonas leprariae]KAB0677371.1 hypothetical protein F6X38_18440 [Aureimonas leprariae]